MLLSVDVPHGKDDGKDSKAKENEGGRPVTLLALATRLIRAVLANEALRLIFVRVMVWTLVAFLRQAEARGRTDEALLTWCAR